MTNNIDEAISSIQESFISIYPELSDYEKSIISNAVRLPMRRTLQSSASMTDSIQEMLSNLSELNYLRNQIVIRKFRLYTQHKIEYDKQFTLLTRLGRPSKQAIDSEIYSTRKELEDMRSRLEEMSNVLEYLDTQISIINMAIKNYDGHRYHIT